MNKAFWYIFVLILVIILVAYYRGTSENIRAAGSATSNLVEILQGRNPSTGQFAAYPGGA